MKLKEKSIKKLPESPWVNWSNMRPRSWDRDNPIETKLKQTIKFNFQST
jgi:hypothetical protein